MDLILIVLILILLFGGGFGYSRWGYGGGIGIGGILCLWSTCWSDTEDCNLPASRRVSSPRDSTPVVNAAGRGCRSRG